jgi:hypothetical protein
MPESLGRPRLIPEREGSAAVTSESLGPRSGVASNSSLASRAESSKSLPDSGWRAPMTLEGVSSKSLSASRSGLSGIVGTISDEPSDGAERAPAWFEGVTGKASDDPGTGPRSSSETSVTSESLGRRGSIGESLTSESLALRPGSGIRRTSESVGCLPSWSIPMIVELELVRGGSDRSSTSTSAS